MHAYGTDDWPGFFPSVAFAKKAPYVSVTFSGVEYRGGSPSKRVGRRLGVLVMGPGEKIAKGLKGKVRHFELAPELGGPGSEYYQYWLGVMEGRFVPGHDLSFGWATPEDGPALEALRRELAAGGGRAFVYFYSTEDTDNAAAKALQNESFFDANVRTSGRLIRAIKLDRAVHAQAFTALGCSETPAVVVIDASFGSRALLEGEIKTKALAKVLSAAAK